MRFSFLLAFLVASLFSGALADYPLTIDHKFGTTLIENRPERVVTLDYNGADNLLALGVQPVAIRYWYGDYPKTVWPWAESLVEGDPEVLKGELNFEQIAATNPDVIIAVWSGISAEDYGRLSLIAPVVAVPEGMGDYAMPWDQQALTVGRVLGQEAEARSRVDQIKQQLSLAAQNNPDWQGKTIAVAAAWEGTVGAYTSQDIRPLLLGELGFVTPEEIDNRIEGNDFWVTFSLEDLRPLDTDVLVWISADGQYDWIQSLVARPFLDVVKEGREVFLGVEMTGAFSHATLLSLPYAIERLVPALEAALDGDPNTHADDRP